MEHLASPHPVLREVYFAHFVGGVMCVYAGPQGGAVVLGGGEGRLRPGAEGEAAAVRDGHVGRAGTRLRMSTGTSRTRCSEAPS